MNKHIGLLTCKAFPDLYLTDQTLIPKLLDYNIDVKPVIWDEMDVSSSDFDAVIFRNTWDYFEKTESFLNFLDSLDSKQIKSLNNTSTIRWNLDKYYLKELEAKGVLTVPSVFIKDGGQLDLSFLSSKEWETFIIKPTISAGSYFTEKHHISELDAVQERYRQLFNGKSLIVQKYMREIEDSGEYSMVFFNRSFSHAVNKTPKKGDFRIQLQFGGVYKEFTPDDQLLAHCSKILSLIPGDLLYARIDGIISMEDFYLMEVELIEPDLYLQFDENRKDNFVKLISEMIGR